MDRTSVLSHQDAKIAPIQPVGWNALLAVLLNTMHTVAMRLGSDTPRCYAYRFDRLLG
jgi:hypothetical protein